MFDNISWPICSDRSLDLGPVVQYILFSLLVQQFGKKIQRDERSLQVKTWSLQSYRDLDRWFSNDIRKIYVGSLSWRLGLAW